MTERIQTRRGAGAAGRRARRRRWPPLCAALAAALLGTPVAMAEAGASAIVIGFDGEPRLDGEPPQLFAEIPPTTAVELDGAASLTLIAGTEQRTLRGPARGELATLLERADDAADSRSRAPADDLLAAAARTLSAWLFGSAETRIAGLRDPVDLPSLLTAPPSTIAAGLLEEPLAVLLDADLPPGVELILRTITGERVLDAPGSGLPTFDLRPDDLALGPVELVARTPTGADAVLGSWTALAPHAEAPLRAALEGATEACGDTGSPACALLQATLLADAGCFTQADQLVTALGELEGDQRAAIDRVRPRWQPVSLRLESCYRAPDATTCAPMDATTAVPTGSVVRIDVEVDAPVALEVRGRDARGGWSAIPDLDAVSVLHHKHPGFDLPLVGTPGDEALRVVVSTSADGLARCGVDTVGPVTAHAGGIAQLTGPGALDHVVQAQGYGCAWAEVQVRHVGTR